MNKLHEIKTALGSSPEFTTAEREEALSYLKAWYAYEEQISDLRDSQKDLRDSFADKGLEKKKIRALEKAFKMNQKGESVEFLAELSEFIETKFGV